MRSYSVAAFCALLLAFVSHATGQVLYNGALGTSPVSQSFLTYGSYLTNPLVSDGNQFTVGATSMTMDSTSDSTIHSGFVNYNAFGTALQNPQFPVLNHNTGYRISLDMQTISESHTGSRAGFSLIALSSDKFGVELGFWANTIFAQSTTFTEAENVNTDTTAALKQYDLTVNGANYTLSSGNTTLLTGPLRDYSSSGALPNVYALPNFVFIGDDTTSANGKTVVSFLSVVPEPATLSLVLLIAVSLASFRRRKPVAVRISR